ncbi:polyketide synthase dehydratase domain-containing protein, partial [Marinicella sediminis]
DEFFLADHKVGGLKVLPGVAYLEMAQAAVNQAVPDFSAEFGQIELVDFMWLQPLVAATEQQVTTTVSLGEQDQIEFQITSSVAQSNESIVHCSGEARPNETARPEPLDVTLLEAHHKAAHYSAEQVYAGLTAMGFEYGPAHRSIKYVSRGDNSLLVQLRLPTVSGSQPEEYLLHPSLLDGLFQASVCLFSDITQPLSYPLIPFSLGSIKTWSPCPDAVYALIRYANDNHAGAEADNSQTQTVHLDMDLYDPEGNLCVQVQGLVLRRLKDVLVKPVASLSPDNKSEFDDEFYEYVIDRILNHGLSVDEAAELE